jgi:hypothetical protein
MLPTAVIELLAYPLESVKRQHEHDLARGFWCVVVPFALDSKCPNAATEWHGSSCLRRLGCVPIRDGDYQRGTHSRRTSGMA